MNILLAEDDGINQLVITRILNDKGHLVDIAGNGLEPLALFDEKQYDIIFMDVQMPEMGGIEAIQKLMFEFQDTVR